jgi:hypothetical protein
VIRASVVVALHFGHGGLWNVIILSTIAERDHRELCYITEVDAVEQTILKTLDRIRARDGEKIFREAAGYLREAVDIVVSERPARTKANGAAAHV